MNTKLNSKLYLAHALHNKGGNILYTPVCRLSDDKQAVAEQLQRSLKAENFILYSRYRTRNTGSR